MKQLLQCLWHCDLPKKPSQQTEEQQQLLHEIVELEKKLHAVLPPDQADMMNHYADLCLHFGAISEEEAFICGVRFAVNFLAEAISTQS